VWIQYGDGCVICTGTVTGRAQDDQSLVQVSINREHERCCAEGASHLQYFPGTASSPQPSGLGQKRYPSPIRTRMAVCTNKYLINMPHTSVRRIFGR
jgi:hypothetical protein